MKSEIAIKIRNKLHEFFYDAQKFAAICVVVYFIVRTIFAFKNLIKIRWIYGEMM